MIPTSFRRPVHLVSTSLLLAALCLAAPSVAEVLEDDQSLPALYAVTGVEPGDELNIRLEPRSNADIIGRLPPQSAGIEVVSRRGNWLQINSNEASGWVAARFLEREAGAPQSGVLPERLACFGTEPFWSVVAAGTSITYNTPDNPDGTLFSIRHVTGAMNSPSPHWIILGERQEQSMTAVVMPQACSDGMSDRMFGLATTIVIDSGDTATGLSGCCSIAPAAQN
ncbi:COG3650 family protein [Georhizobium sp. MAB10]|uniref:COG3650 family protein n=1 Tax=Georhizobium sp. MAB10 TaxID=3028319 RepID=UPI0038557E3D